MEDLYILRIKGRPVLVPQMFSSSYFISQFLSDTCNNM